MIKCPEKRRRRQLHKQARRNFRRRCTLLGHLPFPDVLLLLRFEPFFDPAQDSFDLIHGPIPRARQIARQLNEYATVLAEDHTRFTEAAPIGAPLEISSPRRLRRRKVEFPLGLFDPDSLPSRLYEHKVRTGTIPRANGCWISVRHPHLLFLTGDSRICGTLRQSEYLLRIDGRRIEVFSLRYRPLFCYRLEAGPVVRPNA